MTSRARLVARWPLPEAAGLRDELLAAWDRDGYHDLRHLTEVLDRVEELVATVRCDALPVRLAAWWHDAVHEGRPDDEERSAQWAEEALADDSVLAERVASLVRMTADHRPAVGDVEAAVLSDADLAILAAGDDRYAEYVADVRREYAHVPEADFQAGRAAVLRDLLAGPALFHTAYARREWEERARANVAAELATLAPDPSTRPGL